MKNKILLILPCLFILSNCSINNNEADHTVTKVLWNLVSVSGGVAGVDDDFNLGVIVWTFNEVNSTLTIVNNNTDDTIQDGLDSGTYSFTIESSGNNSFLIIEGNEFGNFTVSETQLIIDQNITTSGTGADGFLYTFQRTFEL